MGATYSYYLHAFSDVRGKGGNLDIGIAHQTDRYQLSVMAKHIVRGVHIVYDDGAHEVLPFLIYLAGHYQVTDEWNVYAQGTYVYT